jgi:hypothetical protein
VSRPPVPPSREEIPEHELDAFDRVRSRMQAMASSDVNLEGSAAYFNALLNSPEMAAGIANMGMLVRTRGVGENSYTHADRELADMVLTHDYGYKAVLEIHIPDALAVGVRLDAIDALLHGRDEELTDDEQQLVTYIRQAVNGTVTDESYAAMEQRMGDRGALDYTAFVLFLSFTIRMWQALGVPDVKDDYIDQMIEDFRTGAREVPDPAVRFR